MADMFLDKEGIPFVLTDDGTLSRIEGDKRVEITDPDSAAHILSRASRTTESEVAAMASRLRHTASK